MEMLPGFAPLAARYDGFIVDLWGVIHDGVKPYPGAAECLAALRAAGKPAVLLSNAPRRVAQVQEVLRGMGIADDLYAGLLTSGEAAHRLLRDRPDDWSRALGRRVLHIGEARDRGVIAELDLDLVDTADAAGWVLNTGLADALAATDGAAYTPLLRDCAARGLPMLCANPDLEIIRDGVRLLCAGTLAQRYQSLGGEVRSLGKPDPQIYAPVLARLGLARARVLAVGDALRTDIAGAQAAGIDACWVLGGIHSDEADPQGAARAAGLAPVAGIAGFVW
jgi:HAD superfamily hydrolase (TIGR01459 family)